MTSEHSLYSINAHLNCRSPSITDTNLALPPQHDARMRQHMLRNNTATKTTDITLITMQITLRKKTVKSSSYKYDLTLSVQLLGK